MISEILSAISVTKQAYETGKKAKGAVDGALRSNLIDATKAGRVEPICLFSNDLLNSDALNPVINNAFNMFIGYYLQATAYLTTVNKIQVSKVLDRLNPDRSISNYVGGMEHYSPQMNHRKQDMRPYYKREFYEYALPSRSKVASIEALSKGLEEQETKKTTFATINDAQGKGDLMLGKTVNVTLGIDNQSVTLPILFTIQCVPIVPFVMQQILLTGKVDETLTETWHAYRSGRRTISDIIFNREAIEAHKKALLLDNTGAYSEILKRVENSVSSSLAGNGTSLNTCSSIYIVSKEVLEEFHRKSGMSMSIMEHRQKIFDATKSMLFIEIDTDYERVRIYHNGIKTYNDLAVKEIKASKKDKANTDVTDVLTELMKGRPPRFV